MRPDTQAELIGHGVPFPEVAWKSMTGRMKNKIRTETENPDGVRRRGLEAEDGEVDEEEAMDIALAAASEQPQRRMRRRSRAACSSTPWLCTCSRPSAARPWSWRGMTAAARWRYSASSR